MKIKQKILVCVGIILALTISVGTASATVTVDTLTKLTDNPYGDSFPDWSPNDDKLIYLEYSSDWWSASRICEMNSDGNYKNEVIPQSAWQPKYSPDGTKIAYASGIFGGDLALKNVITGSVEILVPTYGDYQGICPNWSPDGKKIVYSKYHEPGVDPAQIWIYDLESKTNTKISTDNTDERYPAWSPDGKYISYVRDAQDIWMMDYQEGTKTPITNTPNFEKGVHSWSPSSSMIVYTSNEYGNNDLFIINIDGSGKTRLTTSSSGNAHHPDWSHDGNKIAFSSNRDGNYDIWVMTLGDIFGVPENNPPVANAGGTYKAYEGSLITFNASASSDPDGDSLTYEWDFNNDGIFDFSSSEPYATYTWVDDYAGIVLLRVTDEEGLSDTATAEVTINNVAPEVDAGSDQSVDEGSFVAYSGNFTDPGINDTHTIEWDFGDGHNVSGLLTPSHSYEDDGIYTVILTVTDNDGGIGTDTLNVTVNNVAPIITATGDAIDENDIATVAGSIFDPSVVDTFEVAITWGDGVTNTFSYPAGSTEFSETHQYLDDDPSGTSSDNYTVIVTVTDDDMGEGTESTSVTVNNVVPEVGKINSTIDPIQLGTSITVDSTFTDVGVLDIHTAVWDWGDDSSNSDGIVTESGGSGTVSGVHTYSSAGIYQINLTVTDDDFGFNYSVSNYVVIYDPEGGFVTGGGWINSPEGAYEPNSALVGTANFGFVSKYKNGATVPTGVTQFNFQVADLNFHSDTYQWLVIAGSKAKYKGTGTINGEGEYGFMLTAIDGDLAGDGIDKFRIKIWEIDGDIVYDNGEDLEEGEEITTQLEGGSIKIHKAK